MPITLHSLTHRTSRTEPTRPPTRPPRDSPTRPDRVLLRPGQPRDVRRRGRREPRVRRARPPRTAAASDARKETLPNLGSRCQTWQSFFLRSLIRDLSKSASIGLLAKFWKEGRPVEHDENPRLRDGRRRREQRAVVAAVVAEAVAEDENVRRPVLESC